MNVLKIAVFVNSNNEIVQDPKNSVKCYIICRDRKKGKKGRMTLVTKKNYFNFITILNAFQDFEFRAYLILMICTCGYSNRKEGGVGIGLGLGIQSKNSINCCEISNDSLKN